MRGMMSKSWEVIVPLCTEEVRPRLDHYSQFWLPQYKEDTEELEEGQEKRKVMMFFSALFLGSDNQDVYQATTCEPRKHQCNPAKQFLLLYWPRMQKLLTFYILTHKIRQHRLN